MGRSGDAFVYVEDGNGRPILPDIMFGTIADRFFKADVDEEIHIFRRMFEAEKTLSLHDGFFAVMTLRYRPRFHSVSFHG
jgi:hypothetical protein